VAAALAAVHRIGMRNTRRLLIVSGVIALTTAPVVHAEKFSLSTGVFGITCTSTGQLCDPPETLTIGDPTAALKVRKFVYTAASAHCSSGRILVELDGRLVGKMRFVSRNETATLRKRKGLRLAPGTHTFAFRFEGKVGGCNTGAVPGWGGEITVIGHR
jgi:hypothetical protein